MKIVGRCNILKHQLPNSLFFCTHGRNALKNERHSNSLTGFKNQYPSFCTQEILSTNPSRILNSPKKKKILISSSGSGQNKYIKKPSKNSSSCNVP